MDPEDRRLHLLSAARLEFASRGYHATGVADIIRRAGVARGTFYNYFESKRAVFQAVLGGIIEEVEGAVRPIDVAQPIPPQVRANLQRVVDAVVGPQVTRILFAEAVGIDDEGDADLRAFYVHVFTRIERALGAGQVMGVVRDGDMHLTARCLLGMVKEPAFQAALTGEPLDSGALVAELYRLLSEGLILA